MQDRPGANPAALPADHHTNSLLETLIDAVFDCAPRIRGLQLDRAGPLYHSLLQTARYDICNRSLPKADRKSVQQHEIRIAQTTPDHLHGKAIDQSTIGTFFTPIADILLGEGGSVAIIKPFTFCTNASGKDERNLLINPDRFHLEVVVTSHDNRRIFLSENTDIHESLIVARRPTPWSRA